MGFLDRFRSKAPPDPLERIENRTLLEAMEALAREDSKENRERLYHLLLDVILIVPLPEIPAGAKPGPFVATGHESFQLPLLKDPQGNKLIPAFTDIEALRNWDPNTPYIGLRSVDMFTLILKTEADQIRINLFDPIRRMIRPGGTLTRSEIQLLSEGQLPGRIVGERVAFRPGQQILIGIPAKEPSPEVREALIATASSRENINALFLF